MDNLITVRPITAKHISHLTGTTIGNARRKLTIARLSLNKHKGQVITIEEYCLLKGYDPVKVIIFLGLDKKQ